MSVISIPTGLRVSRQDFGQRRFDLSFASADSGAQQSRILAPPRWICSIIGNERESAADAAQWRQVLLSLRGRVNQLAVYDLLNTAPRGTARGTWTANATAAIGATSLVVNAGVGQAATTILAGDWIGVNQSGSSRQLLHVQADVTLNGSGIGTVTFEPPLRVEVSSGSALAWDKPTCLMRLENAETRWSSVRPMQGGFSAELVESWE